MDTSFKALLIRHLEAESDYRSHVGFVHPDDARNDTASSALAALARYVESLPGDHPTLATLAKLMPWTEGLDVLSPGPAVSDELKQLSMHRRVPPSAALESLVVPAANDLLQYSDNCHPNPSTEDLAEAWGRNPFEAAAVVFWMELTIRDYKEQLAKELREAGASWAVVGVLLDMTRQGAEKKYGGA